MEPEILLCFLPGALPKMTLRDKPGPVVPRRQPVTVCLGPAVANICRLEKDGRTVSRYQNPVPLDDSQGTEDRFLFPAVTEETAGNYRCFCFTRFGRFELREPLELKVAEEAVSTLPSAWAEIFYLEKDGRRVYLYHKSEPQGGLPVTEARFHIPAVSDVTAGSYRCLYENVYEVRSERSEPLQLQVTEEDASTPPSGPASRDYTVENSIRLGLAGVVLLILVAILVEAGHSQRRTPQGPQE
ncbi:leukocyte immunoglobulin-like receptor subfamily A member 5 [Myotis lucifugus]|uniref:leukocyte immunoglobulin-like receptor subfamily A member 5 n=1 Tax=Myotis lucifugus TaxID=59463 RepID=UPI000CCC9AF4|nr:leukocyte immunoglobulin-like receptor subfamily A member 5 [Myotis lucifugus]